jgi:hypothetical protein
MYAPVSGISGKKRFNTTVYQDLVSGKGIFYIMLSMVLGYLLLYKPAQIPFARLASLSCASSPADRPSIQYVLVIDAGSTGSRIQ